MFCHLVKCYFLGGQPLRQDPHSRARNYVAEATALGASVRKRDAILFLPFLRGQQVVQIDGFELFAGQALLEGREL